MAAAPTPAISSLAAKKGAMLVRDIWSNAESCERGSEWASAAVGSQKRG